MQTHLHWISLGIFSALLTYMIVALVNDSTVCTASVYWVLLGLGIAVNRSLACNGELQLMSRRTLLPSYEQSSSLWILGCLLYYTKINSLICVIDIDGYFTWTNHPLRIFHIKKHILIRFITI